MEGLIDSIKKAFMWLIEKIKAFFKWLKNLVYALFGIKQKVYVSKSSILAAYLKKEPKLGMIVVVKGQSDSNQSTKQNEPAQKKESAPAQEQKRTSDNGPKQEPKTTAIKPGVIHEIATIAPNIPVGINCRVVDPDADHKFLEVIEKDARVSGELVYELRHAETGAKKLNDKDFVNITGNSGLDIDKHKVLITKTFKTVGDVDKYLMKYKSNIFAIQKLSYQFDDSVHNLHRAFEMSKQNYGEKTYDMYSRAIKFFQHRFSGMAQLSDLIDKSIINLTKAAGHKLVFVDDDDSLSENAKNF